MASRYLFKFALSKLLIGRTGRLVRGKAKSAAILIAHGVDGLELSITAGILRRACIAVSIAGVPRLLPIVADNNIVVTPDSGVCEVLIGGEFDAIVLLGGCRAVRHLSFSEEVKTILMEQESRRCVIAAATRAPQILAAHGIMRGRRLTGHPETKEILSSRYCYSEESLVVDRELITSSTTEATFQFALAIVNVIMGRQMADEVKSKL